MEETYEEWKERIMKKYKDLPEEVTGVLFSNSSGTGPGIHITQEGGEVTNV